MKYHISAIIANILVITAILYLGREFYELFDELYFVKRGGYYDRYFTYLLFFFSWMSTFLVYKVKNYRRHFYYFIAFNLIFIIVFFSVKHVIYNHGTETPLKMRTILRGIYYALRECTLPLIVVSVLVHISQNFIGKKLLPKKYKPLN